MDENRSDSKAIAARIRSLITALAAGDFQAVAGQLHVDEVALRMSVDDVAPYPTLDVLVAVVQAYGVDPAWLITGEYDLKIHRAAISDERTHARSVVMQLLGAQVASTPPGVARRTTRGLDS
ncbi:MAG TPA: hypothetical protein VII52_03685 [Gemmatimonadaceae bacterium]